MAVQSNVKKYGLSMAGNRLVSVAAGYSMARIKIVQNFKVPSRDIALAQVDQILARGSFASMTNVAGGFVVKELVLA